MSVTNLVVAEAIALDYQVKPAITNDLAFYERVSRHVKNQAPQHFLSWGIQDFEINIEEFFTIAVKVITVAPAGAAVFHSKQTRIIANNGSARQREKAGQPSSFAEEILYPNDYWQSRYESLKNLEAIQARVLQIGEEVLASPYAALDWVTKHHSSGKQWVRNLIERAHPVLLFEGDPGVGKSDLARSMGDCLARKLGTQIRLVSTSLAIRGTGKVGEISANLDRTFREVTQLRDETGTKVILLLEEADSLVQARDEAQQHHEDRNAVNTILQALDRLRGQQGLLVIFTTNLGYRLDPAFERRVRARFYFPRPDQSGRFAIVQSLLGPVLQEDALWKLIDQTADYTPADLQRVCLDAVQAAIFRDIPLSEELLLEVASGVLPTRDLGSLTHQA